MNFNKLVRKISKKTGKLIYDYHLIDENDNVMVGLSGGKDSLTLIDILHMKKIKMPINFSISACFVELEDMGHQIDIKVLEKFCTDREISFHHIKINPDFNIDKKKDKCFICSWHRRKALFNLCRETKSNKLALGHHQDDLIKTFLMNITFQGNISTMPVKLSMFNGELFIIRPLAAITEEQIIKYVQYRDLKVQKHECQYGQNQSRVHIEKVISEMQKLNPKAKESIFKALGNIKKDYLL